MFFLNYVYQDELLTLSIKLSKLAHIVTELLIVTVLTFNHLRTLSPWRWIIGMKFKNEYDIINQRVIVLIQSFHTFLAVHTFTAGSLSRLSVGLNLFADWRQERLGGRTPAWTEQQEMKTTHFDVLVANQHQPKYLAPKRCHRLNFYGTFWSHLLTSVWDLEVFQWVMTVCIYTYVPIN